MLLQIICYWVWSSDYTPPESTPLQNMDTSHTDDVGQVSNKGMAKVKYVGGKGVMWSLSSICSLGKKKKKCNGDVYEWNDSVTP